LSLPVLVAASETVIFSKENKKMSLDVSTDQGRLETSQLRPRTVGIIIIIIFDPRKNSVDGAGRDQNASHIDPLMGEKGDV
jgi:hypothetical protein